MAQHVLFLIHGMGQQGDDWSQAPIATLSEVAKQYGFFQKPEHQNLADLIRFVPIRYDDIFDRILDNWANLESGLQGAGSLAPDAGQKVLGYLEECGDESNTFLRYGGDVLLYRGFRLFAQRVQIRVIARIAREIADRRAETDGGGVRFSVLAHSLGTTVAHDALHLLGTEQWLGAGYEFEEDQVQARSELDDARNAKQSLPTTTISNPFAPTYFRFDRLFMVANTSALLHEIPEGPYDSIVRPNTPGNPNSYCERYYNIAHKWDPVPRARSFLMPDAWQTGDHGVDLTGLDHLYDKDIHSLSHYVTHPEVHLRLLSSLIAAFEISTADVAVKDAFPRVSPAIKAAAQRKLEEFLKSLAKKVSTNTSIETWIGIYRQLREWVEAQP